VQPFLQVAHLRVEYLIVVVLFDFPDLLGKFRLCLMFQGLKKSLQKCCHSHDILIFAGLISSTKVPLEAQPDQCGRLSIMFLQKETCDEN
jgi:hypothetical protein